MQRVYRIENVESILDYDQYIKDFEEQAAEYCKGDARSILQDLFAAFTTECGQIVYLSGEETRKGSEIRFKFKVYLSEENKQPIVIYLGYR